MDRFGECDSDLDEMSSLQIEVRVTHMTATTHRQQPVKPLRTPNKRMHANRRPAFQFRCSGFSERWICCERTFPAAVGDPVR